MFQFCCLCCFPGPGEGDFPPQDRSTQPGVPKNVEKEIGGASPQLGKRRGKNKQEIIEMQDNPGFYDAHENLEGYGAGRHTMEVVPGGVGGVRASV